MLVGRRDANGESCVSCGQARFVRGSLMPPRPLRSLEFELGMSQGKDMRSVTSTRCCGCFAAVQVTEDYLRDQFVNRYTFFLGYTLQLAQ